MQKIANNCKNISVQIEPVELQTQGTVHYWAVPSRCSSECLLLSLNETCYGNGGFFCGGHQ